MAYRNTIISFASLIALGTACSKAPSYSTGVQSAATGDATGLDTEEEGHAPDKPVSSTEPKKEEAAPVKPADTATPPPAAPAQAAMTPEQKAKLIAERGFVAYAVNAPSGASWNPAPAAANPFIIGQTVNAAGAIDAAKPVTVFFCNFSAGNMRIHSDNNGGPMDHGANFAGVAAAVAPENMPAMQAMLDKADLPTIQGMANCRAHPVNGLGVTPNATYNHIGGNAGDVNSRIFFSVYTVSPAGVVAKK